MTRTAEGPDATRAVEIIVESAEGPGRRGSGYRVTGGTVLTAAHVIAAAAALRVRCNADSPEARCRPRTARSSSRPTGSPYWP
ncbi:hypothetical protein [Streptomyces sp. UG1]|uniref:hypothetical protein n=1 Tax=Streptomyces sp. UG1 TaxID=3417652 RepID=UPI003CE6C103